MRIAVLSGKGGTGKTFVSVNLVKVAGKAEYIDCDVEEPNGWLFLKPNVEKQENVSVMVPKVKEELCNGCRKCVDFCKYNALAHVGDRLLIFNDICHSCGGCVLLCPEKALIEEEREIGNIEYGLSGIVRTRTGRLDMGEATGTPIIHKLLEGIPSDRGIFIDCPPGSSCLAMDSVKDSDYCILVAEPTRFGAHNLAMVYELVKLFKKPHGVIINKAIRGENIIDEFCKERDISVLAKIPYNQEIALENSRGNLLTEKQPYQKLFKEIYHKIQQEVLS